MVPTYKYSFRLCDVLGKIFYLAIISGHFPSAQLCYTYIFCHTGYNPCCLSQNMSHLPVAMHILYDMYAEYGCYSQCYIIPAPVYKHVKSFQARSSILYGNRTCRRCAHCTPIHIWLQTSVTQIIKQD